MTLAIPASEIVSVTPGVLGAGGTAITLNGLILTNSTQIPFGTVQSFPSALAVSNYFGPTSQEALMAGVYFQGFDNSNKKPGALLFTGYSWGGAQVAWLMGGSLATMTLAQLQALTPGTITITIDGTPVTSSSINLSTATSFSNAASLILTALGFSDAVCTASIANTGVMTVTAMTSGTLGVGQKLSGTGVNTGISISRQLTGATGGVGTYQTSQPTTVTSTTITAGAPNVIFNSVSNAFEILSGTLGVTSSVGFASGALATSLNLTQATGAYTSPGSGISNPMSAMAAVLANTQNWACFTTTFEPVVADKVLFAQWTSTQNNQFAYAGWDTNIVATQNPDTGTFGQLVQAAGYSGAIPIYAPVNGNLMGAFILGCAASIDFTMTNGRYNIAFRAQSGLQPDVTSATIAPQLIANGYNFYGAYGNGAFTVNFFYPGSIAGPFAWIDSYFDQIWLNSSLQANLLSLLTSAGSIPYNAAGYALIEAACLAPITAAVNFGAIRAGVSLSPAQSAYVNASAGINVATTVQNRGWYLNVSNASATVRAARGSPPITLWYTDGQSVQSISLFSEEVV